MKTTHLPIVKKNRPSTIRAVWISLALLLVALPHLFGSGSAIGMFSLMGVAIIFALSYNMLLGQTGLLSFGHAVYFGLGGFFCAQLLVAIADQGYPVPLVLVPVVGGLVGLFFAAILGVASTKRGGTVFAMISLGIAELVIALVALMTGLFGGEQGISVDRTETLPIMGFHFGSQIEVFYLIAFWCFVCMLTMYFITKTPFGKLCNAVRDNPERVAYIGYSTRSVRFIAFVLSGTFAGIAGSLSVINFEMAAGSMLGAHQSASVLLMTYIGGVGSFAGPVIGAILVTLLQMSLSDLTPAWQLYLGLLFVLAVMYMPGGIAQVIALHVPLAQKGLLHRLARPYLHASLPFFCTTLSTCLAIELTYRLTVDKSHGPILNVWLLTLDASSAATWIGVALLFLVGVVSWRFLQPGIMSAISEVMEASRNSQASPKPVDEEVSDLKRGLV